MNVEEQCQPPEQPTEAPAPPPYPPYPSGLAIAALVCGIVSVFTPPCGIVAGICAIVLGGVTLGRKSGSPGMCVAGIATGTLGLVIGGALVALVILGVGGFPDGGTDPTASVGEEAPDFELTDLEGNRHTLGQYRGKKTILDFWATWCQPCREEMPHYQELYEEYSRDELVILLVSDEEVAAQKEFRDEHSLTLPMLQENDTMPQLYQGIFSIPTTFVIDEDGIIQAVFVGYTGKEEFEAEIDAPSYCDKIIAECTAVLSDNPDDYDAHSKLTFAYLTKNNLHDAVEHGRAAVESAQADATDYYNLACVLSLLGNNEEAIREIEAAFEKGFEDIEHARQDPDLENIRGEPAFENLIAKYE